MRNNLKLLFAVGALVALSMVALTLPGATQDRHRGEWFNFSCGPFTLPAAQANLDLCAFEAPMEMVLDSVQMYASAVTGTQTCSVVEAVDGDVVADVALVAGAPFQATITATGARIADERQVDIRCDTAAASTITNGYVVISARPR